MAHFLFRGTEVSQSMFRKYKRRCTTSVLLKRKWAMLVGFCQVVYEELWIRDE
jgi:hypothetical protein